MKLLGGVRAAGDITALEHQHPPALFCQQRRGGNAVGAGTDHDRVVAVHDEAPRISSAASRPPAPIIPPPGCVPEPHCQSPRTGVRYCAHPGDGRRKKSWCSASSPWKMFPSVSPVMRSMSAGVSTCFSMMMSRMFGANCAIASITALPKASRFMLSQPPVIVDGAYWTNTDITCLPAGAMPGSIIDGRMMSAYGRRENDPYFASSYARSTYSSDGEMEIAPRRCRPTPGMQVK